MQGITVSVQGQRVLRKDQCFSAAFHILLQVNMGFRFTGAFLIYIGNCLFPCGKLRAFPIHFHEHCFLCHAHRQDVVSRHIPCRNIIPGYIARISRVITVVIGYVPCIPRVVTVVAGYIACIPRGVTVVAGHVTPGNLCRTDNLTALRKRGSSRLSHKIPINKRLNAFFVFFLIFILFFFYLFLQHNIFRTFFPSLPYTIA